MVFLIKVDFFSLKISINWSPVGPRGPKGNPFPNEIFQIFENQLQRPTPSSISSALHAMWGCFFFVFQDGLI